MKEPSNILVGPEIPLDFLGEFNSNWINLFHQLSKLITDEMVWYIAKADYGYKKEVCYKQLKKILKTKDFPLKPEFILLECLELTRWIIPKNKNEHIIRGFSSVLLLILADKSEYFSDGENETLITLLDSTLSLRLEFESVQQFIIWRILSDYEKEKKYYIEEDDIESIDEITIDEFFIYALLLTMVFNVQKEKDVEIVADWILEMDKFNKNLPPYYSKEREENLQKYNIVIDSKQFILGTTNFKQHHYLWKEVSKKVLQDAKYIKQESISIKLDNIIKCILNEEI